MIIRKYQPSDCKKITDLFYNTVHNVNAKESVFLIQDMEANGIGADLRKYAGQTKREIREVIARNKDFLKCITKPSSKYLGDAVDLNSSGDITND